MSGPARSASVFTHRRPSETAPALRALVKSARAAGVDLRFDPVETAKHRIEASEGVVTDCADMTGVDVAVALGGDGTILTALRRYAGTGTPVFAVNFGEIGFLATVDPESAEAGFDRAFAGDFNVLELPMIGVQGDEDILAIAANDVSLHRRPGGRVAQLSYAVEEDEVGRVRCDGLVVATPAGSTGYNLANGGPVLAWGVEGYVVSFIAPHSLTARSLVVAPADVLTLRNRSREESVDVSVDGRPVGEMPAGAAIELRFLPGQGCLAQVSDASFYHRLRQKFGRLAS